MGIHGYEWNPIEIIVSHGYDWNPMDMNGIPWIWICVSAFHDFNRKIWIWIWIESLDMDMDMESFQEFVFDDLHLLDAID